jgi:hypothetical protein
VLAILARLIGVEADENGAHHLAGVIVAKRLAQGVQCNSCACQISLGAGIDKFVAAKATERMDQDDVERRGFGSRLGEHLLKDGPVLVGARGAGLDVLPSQLDAMLLAPRLGLSDLIRDGQVRFGLTGRGYPGVERHTLGCGEWNAHLDSDRIRLIRPPRYVSTRRVSASVTGNAGGKSTETSG